MKKSEALKILGLQDGASDEDIKKAHRKLVIENHPDKFGQDEAARARAEEKTKQINEARDVLLSRKWDPESYTAGTPYGAPFSYQPYSRPAGSSKGNPQDPFAGTPFEGMNFVWTSWDSQGNQTENPFSTSNPFTGSIPFDFSGFGVTITPEEQLKREKDSLKTDIEILIAKIVVLVATCFFGLPAMGLYLYTVVTLVQAVYKKLKILSIFVLAPLLFLAFLFLPIASTPIGFFAAAFFFFAIWYDVKSMRQHYRVISTLKMKKPKEDKSK